MNLVAVIVILLLVFLLYKLLGTYDRLAKELREIRTKCVSPAPSFAPAAPSNKK